ncbi:MAG TPA: transposase [Caldithrix sp.]|nr:transposase [Caldithrix sp.]HES59168.1 transposase [Caldithrix sp.]
MFTLSSNNKFHLYSHPTDMRKSFDGLSGVVQNHLESNPCNGDVFIFINRRRDKIKLLHWQGISFTLYYKRLEKGTFELPAYDSSVGSITINYTQLVMIVDGLSIKNIEKRKRYTPETATVIED